MAQDPSAGDPGPHPSPAELARRALGRIDALLAKTHEVLEDPGLEDEPLRDYLLEGVLAKTLLDLAAHIERIAVLTALEIDGYVPPRSEDGARALFDLVTRPTRLRPALLRDYTDLRAVLRERHGRGFSDRAGAPALLKQFRRLEARAIPSLRAGLEVIGPILDREGRAEPRTPQALAARALHAERLCALAQLAEEVRALARERGRDIRFFGSLTRGRVHEESDLDVLILGEVPAGRWSDPFIRDIEDLGKRRGISVDVVFGDDAPHLEEGAIP